MVKLLPDSQRYLMAEEGGGGNRVSEEQIKGYLQSVLLAAPHEPETDAPPFPEWGLSQGWGEYLAREQGRWEGGGAGVAPLAKPALSIQVGGMPMDEEATGRAGGEPVSFIRKVE